MTSGRGAQDLIALLSKILGMVLRSDKLDAFPIYD